VTGPYPRRAGKAVPATRVGRFARVARLAGGVAGGMLAEGARQFRAGNRPRKRDLLLTPANARRVTKQLSEMRGAAMKLGQILSMDTGDLLPKELTDILASLRNDATSMPDDQLEAAMARGLRQGLGGRVPDLRSLPDRRGVHRPGASGRGARRARAGPEDPVSGRRGEHRQRRRQHRHGVCVSRGSCPDEVDMTPLLDDAKRQLRTRPTTSRKAKFLERFNEVLGEDERFVLPELVPELTRRNVLAMTYVAGGPIDAIARRPGGARPRDDGPL
jgi:predicted unusual protein kinase regulating ubiquinone biosynthesis (AarF/ABC1/UbiB family)